MKIGCCRGWTSRTTIEEVWNAPHEGPPHPGAFVRSEIIDGHDLSVTAAAKALGVTRQALSELVNSRTSLSAEMAVRLEKAFGVSMDTLLRMQSSYDIAQARQRAPSIDVQPYKAAVVIA